jgi:hypothetical protein
VTDIPRSGPGDDTPDLVSSSASLRAEWQTEQDATVHEAAEEWLHGRTLGEVARECLHRGDPVRVTLANQKFAGEVLEVGHDLLAIRSQLLRVDLHLHPSVPLFLEPERKRNGGPRGVAAAGSFRGALLAREQEAIDVVVGTTFTKEELEGRVVVGRDHVCVVGPRSAETYVPLAGVAYVTARGRSG